jgi:predicted O-methyltransferase YrrM
MLLKIQHKIRKIQNLIRLGRNPFVGAFPPGHFYSPLPSLKEAQRGWIPGEKVAEVDLPGFDPQRAVQLAFLSSFPAGLSAPAWTRERGSGFRYYIENGFYCWQDALVLSAVLSHFQPEKVVEIGSGFSSAAMVDIRNHGLFHGRLTFIEPYPERLDALLLDERETIVHRKPVQEVPLQIFSDLEKNDVLFVDSSHVVKVGSDLHYILFTILPALRPGVIVHFHDIFWPFDYPEAWYRRGWAWNEAYALRLLLTYSKFFRIICFNSYLNATAPEAMRAWLRTEAPFESGGLWLMKV